MTGLLGMTALSRKPSTGITLQTNKVSSLLNGTGSHLLEALSRLVFSTPTRQTSMSPRQSLQVLKNTLLPFETLMQLPLNLSDSKLKTSLSFGDPFTRQTDFGSGGEPKGLKRPRSFTELWETDLSITMGSIIWSGSGHMERQPLIIVGIQGMRLLIYLGLIITLGNTTMTVTSMPMESWEVFLIGRKC